LHGLCRKNKDRMMIEKIKTKTAPAAIGPYSQAIVLDSKLVFTAGQIPLDPATGEMNNATIEAATRQVLENLKAVLEAAGSSLGKVIKVTVFLQNFADFAAMNEIYAEYFGDSLPARSAIQAAALPKDAMIEIEAIASL